VGTEHADDAEPFRLEWAGKTIMGTLRTLNNLCERMHVAYFFYINLGHMRFVSIGRFLPAFGVILGAMLLRAVALLVQASNTASRGPSVRQQTGGKAPAAAAPTIAAAIGRWLSAIGGGILLLQTSSACLPFFRAFVAHLVHSPLAAYDPDEVAAWAAVVGGCAVGFAGRGVMLALLGPVVRSWRLESAVILIGSAVVALAVGILNIGLGMAILACLCLPCLFFAPTASSPSSSLPASPSTTSAASPRTALRGAGIAAKRLLLVALLPCALGVVAVAWGTTPSSLLVHVLRDYVEVGAWAWPAICGIVWPTLSLLL